MDDRCPKCGSENCAPCETCGCDQLECLACGWYFVKGQGARPSFQNPEEGRTEE